MLRSIRCYAGRAQAPPLPREINPLDEIPCYAGRGQAQPLLRETNPLDEIPCYAGRAQAPFLPRENNPPDEIPTLRRARASPPLPRETAPFDEIPCYAGGQAPPLPRVLIFSVIRALVLFIEFILFPVFGIIDDIARNVLICLVITNYAVIKVTLPQFPHRFIVQFYCFAVYLLKYI